MAYRRRRLTQRRRKLAIDLNQIFDVSKQYHKGRTGHYGTLGSPLTNYKKNVNIPTVTQRRTSPISETIGEIKKAYNTGKNLYSIYNMVKYRKRKTRPRRRRLSIPLGFPRKKLVRFKLFGNDSLTGTTGALATSMIKANSLNDAMGSAGAQLPWSSDQWAAFYGKYTILGSKIKVRFGVTTNTGPIYVGVHLHKNSTALTSASHYKEVPLTKMKMLTTQKDGGIITMKYSGKRFWHVGSISSDSEQEGTITQTPGTPTSTTYGDPTDLAYYHIFVQDMVGSHTAVVDYAVELEFICMLNEPVNVDRSSL